MGLFYQLTIVAVLAFQSLHGTGNLNCFSSDDFIQFLHKRKMNDVKGTVAQQWPFSNLR